MKILLPVDGSENSLRATRFAITLAQLCTEPAEVHLLTVQPPVLSGEVKTFVSQSQINNYYHHEGSKTLASARELLDQAGVHYVVHIGVGQVAETIAAYVRDQACDQVVMGTRGLGRVSSVLLGSVTTSLIPLIDVPLTLVK